MGRSTHCESHSLSLRVAEGCWVLGLNAERCSVLWAILKRLHPLISNGGTKPSIYRPRCWLGPDSSMFRGTRGLVGGLAQCPQCSVVMPEPMCNLIVSIPVSVKRRLRIQAAERDTTITALVMPGIERASHGPANASTASPMASEPSSETDAS